MGTARQPSGRRGILEGSGYRGNADTNIGSAEAGFFPITQAGKEWNTLWVKTHIRFT
jgi:hypothetical protein